MRHLWLRLQEAALRLEPVAPKYCVIWEDPVAPDAPLKRTYAFPEWMAVALEGGVLPPIETYLRDQDLPEGERPEHPYAEPIGPMTQEEAMEYLVKQVIPPRVWRDYRGNRQIFRIVPVDWVPTDTTHRDSWSMNQ